MYHILIIKQGEDSGLQVQYAHSEEHAQYLIDEVLAKPLPGYYYKIVYKFITKA